MKIAGRLFLILFLSSSFLSAQQTNREYLFTQLRMEDGLSQSSVYCIIQDMKGYLWVGTANGLNRYDGYTFKIYYTNPLDSTSISDNGIFSLLEDKDGIIWVGTVEGVLNKFNRQTETFERFRLLDTMKVESATDENFYGYPIPFSRSNDKSVTSLAEDKEGNLWIGTWGMGLVKYNKKENSVVHFYKNPASVRNIGSNRIRSVVVDSDGVVWAGSLGDGLIRIIPSNGKQKTEQYDITIFRHSSKDKTSLSDNRVTSLFIDKDKNIFIGTYGGGFNVLSKSEQDKDQSSVRFINFKNNLGAGNSLSSNTVMAILQDHLGYYWMGTFGGGMDRFDYRSKTYTHFRNDPMDLNSLSKNDILSIFEDRSGNLWVGTLLGKGLNKVERTSVKFNQISKASMSAEQAGSAIKGLDDDVVWSLYPDKDSVLWIGTFKGGLNRFDRKNFKFTYYEHNPANPNSISDNHVRAIAGDRFGNLWIGTYNGGLNKFNKQTHRFVSYVHSDYDSLSLGANQVQSIYIDSSDTIWIGTFGGGLNYFKYNRNSSNRIEFKKYLNNPIDPFSISDNRVYCIYEDREGTLWIGTFGGGLDKFDRNSGKFISYRNIPDDVTSLSDNRVMSVYEDENGFLWVGTFGGGLHKFDKKTERFIRYNQKNRINISVVYGVLEDKNKNLWFSSDDGIFKFNIAANSFVQYDLHDGLQGLEFSGGAYAQSESGEMFFGGINGVNYFYPDSVKDNQSIPPIVISQIRIFNEPISGEHDTLVLDFNQNFFSVEFSAMDFTHPLDNQYAYYLQGIDPDWHYVDAKRRIASYTNLSPGEYVFRVRGSNNDGVWNNEGAALHLIVLPPFWQRWWFISIAVIVIGFIIYYLSTIRFRSLLAIEKLKVRLAADLHDSIGSGLTEISILSEIAAANVSSSKGTEEQLKSVSEKSRQLIDNMSDIVWMINPKKDSLYDLILRLKDIYSDFLGTFGISFKTVNIEEFASLKLPMDYKQNLFLIFKEAINNAIKYSKCRKITLEANLNKDELQLILTDDGIGMDIEKVKKGNGLINIFNRANKLGGSVKLDSVPEKGTTIKFVGKITTANKLKLFFSK